MTDNEIIKALECCNRPANQTSCDDCPYRFIDEKCSSKLINDALNLINRQKAEIERLKKENEILSKNADTAFQDGLNETQDLYANQIKSEVRAETIKEFAERLKEEFLNLEYQANTERKTLPIALVKDQVKWIMHEVSIKTIDNLVKEMVDKQRKEDGK